MSHVGGRRLRRRRLCRLTFRTSSRNRALCVGGHCAPSMSVLLSRLYDSSVRFAVCEGLAGAAASSKAVAVVVEVTVGRFLAGDN